VPACREQGKVVESTTLRQSPKDAEWLTKLRCYTAATPLQPPGSPTTTVSVVDHSQVDESAASSHTLGLSESCVEKSTEAHVNSLSGDNA
jgi:hypothetical protein